MIQLFILGMAVSYGSLILYYRHGWSMLPECSKDPPRQVPVTRVSVVIPTRNEEHNILACLQAIIDQHYPVELFEVLVVNDHSTDRTADLVRSFPAENIHLVNLSEHIPAGKALNAYKKKAIETAISLSRGDLIITTDADCVMGREWMSNMVDCYEREKCRFIAGPVAFHQEDNLFKCLQSLDFVSLQGMTGAIIGLGTGAVCNGANLAYEKKAFQELGGFSGIDHLASGDDTLLMHKMQLAFPGSVLFLKCPAAIVSTLPLKGFNEFFQQRIRWSSKIGRLDDHRMLAMLIFMYCWNLLFPALAVIAAYHPDTWFWLAALLLYKAIIEWVFLVPVARFFGKLRMLWLLFPAQFLHIPYILLSVFLGKVKTYQWKGRRVS
ncbi:MAG TPA: glycosyltransferase [Chitinophagaceae bacterium]|nr:glycosyltransferase [Chitinophagaceae bacterium]